MSVLAQPTGRRLGGLALPVAPGLARLRDWVPHLLGEGLAAWRAADRIETGAPEVADALRVVRQVVRTAAITAPPDLWLLRQVLSALAATGWRERLAEGVHDVPPELEPDLTLLLSRGYLVRAGAGWRWAELPTAQRVLREVGPLPERPADLSARWAAALSGDRAHDALLADVLAGDVPAAPHPPPSWVATPEDLELGYRLVPLVLGLRAAQRIPELLDHGALPLPAPLADRARATLRAAGWLGDGAVTPLGRRGLERGPGPFGIIETYHPYLAALPRIWAEGRAAVHVARAGNVAASQDANRATFQRANDALDRFCADTGFPLRVFVEHAVGRGEAIRQRWARAGDGLVYVGADLEAEALAAAQAEVAAGRLPPDVAFVQADIAQPEALVGALRARGVPTEGAVMLVGNGFHEVRDRSDDRMVAVFRGYCEAGIVLLLTEESALSVDDLLRTAWNTYHAGFRYVHERSGQGLRPASPAPGPAIGPPLPASWQECAVRAGYVALERYGSRSRTIYPYPPADGHNPSVSTNLFLVPPAYAP
ncbi:MAG: hypothetical protein R3F59_20310 [Myxococcota bacterium]